MRLHIIVETLELSHMGLLMSRRLKDARLLVTRYTAGVPGIPPTNAGRQADAD